LPKKNPTTSSLALRPYYSPSNFPPCCQLFIQLYFHMLPNNYVDPHGNFTGLQLPSGPSVLADSAILIAVGSSLLKPTYLMSSRWMLCQCAKPQLQAGSTCNPTVKNSCLCSSRSSGKARGSFTASFLRT